MKIYTDLFEKIISLENLFTGFDEFKRDKQNKKDVLKFEWNLESNIVELHRELKYHNYKHGVYTKFIICDPKPRIIHKATVRDRVLHHAIFSVLNPLFEPCFISHSFSCRVGKGTHKGVETLTKILRQVSQNGTRPCFALKCDVKKFFASVDHSILLGIIKRKIKDDEAIWLLWEIIESFPSASQIEPLDKLGIYERENTFCPRQESLFAKHGLPIGNLTSQLFANIYLNEFDYFIKHELRIKNYLRYTDDFVIVGRSEGELLELLPKIEEFLSTKLKLSLHPNKVEIRKYRRGVDFLGYVVLHKHIKLRTKTSRRIFKKLKKRIEQYKSGIISKNTLVQSLNSYLGVLSHADSYKLCNELENSFWFWLRE
ncbi:MAG: reverse transcriptase domain-containing protein [Candidatus Berkelbacteria bacterium]|nr:reverse transcriptase domain-containing protein [Candidatus Berkelbacteria bacterium]